MPGENHHDHKLVRVNRSIFTLPFLMTCCFWPEMNWSSLGDAIRSFLHIFLHSFDTEATLKIEIFCINVNKYNYSKLCPWRIYTPGLHLSHLFSIHCEHTWWVTYSTLMHAHIHETEMGMHYNKITSADHEVVNDRVFACKSPHNSCLQDLW